MPSEASPLGELPDVASPIVTAPAKAMAQPASNRDGKPSPRNRPPMMAIRIGPTLTSIAAVPASTYRSAVFKARL